MDFAIIIPSGLAFAFCGLWIVTARKYQGALVQLAHLQARYEAMELSKTQMTETFHALSSEALLRNNQAFLTLAKETLGSFQQNAEGTLKAREVAISTLVAPLGEALKKVDEKIQGLEKERVVAYHDLKAQVTDLVNSQKDLRLETSNLVKALRTPHVRGRWGEMQLRRVVEIAGMIPHCDFVEQESFKDAESNTLQRPDMIVKLPGNKSIVIDSKVPLAAYLEALEAKDEATRILHLKNHARHVKNHILSLSAKAYWDQAAQGTSVEFVVLFIPGDPIFSAALEQDPQLIELGVEKKVILATPTTLIALLHAASYGWRQEALAQNAQEISQLGKELYKRLGDMGGHMGLLGRHLSTAVDTYNKTVGTIERRVLPMARRFKDLKATSVGSEDLPELLPLDTSTRLFDAPEMLEDPRQKDKVS
jgi:DNA recombination protein RmuC